MSVVVAVVAVLVKILQVIGAVQEVAEMLIPEDPGLLVVVAISGTAQVEVDSQPVSSAAEVALVEACETNIGVPQVMTDVRCLALEKAPSLSLVCLI